MKGSKNFPQLMLRLPGDLKDWLAKRAEAASRSLNSEAVLRLEDSRKREEQAGNAQTPA
jgi:hypothetical protein